MNPYINEKYKIKNKDGGRMFLGEVLKNDFQLWKGGDSIIIEASTGTGKTTFVLETLLPYAKSQNAEILFLSNRNLLKNQVKVKIAQKQGLPVDDIEWIEEVDEFDGITVLSYQKLQDVVHRGNDYKYYRRYKFVVYDEIHYLLEDSSFNSQIYYLQEFIHKCYAISIFMSATMEDVRYLVLELKYSDKILWYTEEQMDNYLSKILVNTYTWMSIGEPTYVWNYQVPYEKRSNIKCQYFKDDVEIIDLIKSDKSGEKWLWFFSNKHKAKKVKQELGEMADIISSDDKNSNIIDSIVQNERFACKVLITTKLLDNGVTIKDLTLCNIVINTTSKTEFLQMFGRKRFINEDDKLTLYIPIKDKKSFAGHKELELKQIMQVLHSSYTTGEIVESLLSEKDLARYIRNFFVWEDNKFVLNSLAKIYYENKLNFVKRMQSALQKDDFAYVKEVLQWLELEETFDKKNCISILKEKKSIEELQQYLESKVGMELDVIMQESFRQKVDSIIKNSGTMVSGKKKRLPGKKVLNDFFRKYNLGYEIMNIKSHRKGEKTRWKVTKKTAVG